MRVGFVGAGNLVEALVAGLVGSGQLPPTDILVINRSRVERLAALRRQWGVSAAASHRALVEGSDVVVLAVKPQDATQALQQIAPWLDPRHLVVSAAAGLTLAAVAARLGQGVRCVRAMPNTSVRVGASMTALTAGASTTADDRLRCERLFASVGRVVWVDEAHMNAVTALSGSGPAYVYRFLELLAEAGEAAGLPRELAQELSLETLTGAAAMLRKSGLAPRVLREQITSPGGTTRAGLDALERAGLPGAVRQAVASATERARELGS